ncbi:hypothetical protein QWZ10_25465 [Paracoccus cavernae]|uniref:Uncharacterized protein n=1 Tax=Paracoccus cavernae TaxID=1571207 RepID=A0ABT8DBZ2_9RHOB|nr:hypothetical protein [Paracoccus cavernae]
MVYLSIGALVGALVGALAASAAFFSFPQNAADPLVDITGAPALTEAELDAEDDFLRIDMGKDDASVAEIEPLKNAGNVRYIACEKPADLVEVLGKKGDENFVVRRNIDRYLRLTNVLATKDCTCTGKLVPASAILAFEEELKEIHGVEKLTHETGALLTETHGLFDQAEEMCGRPF